MDNATTQLDNQSTQEEVSTETSTSAAPATASVTPATGAWKSGLSTDMRNSPLLSKFEDTSDGLSKAFESHLNLEKLLGHEKVPLPKDINDVDGWNRFGKALGVPDKAEGYGLPDAQMPDDLKGLTIDKNKFAEVMHAHKVHPHAVKEIWKMYQQINVDNYKSYMEKQKAQLTEGFNRLRGEWGDTFDTNVELGQMVINKFSDDQDMNDYITAALVKDPKGVKFLAKLGSQFAENNIGEFKMKNFSMNPVEAQAEIDKAVHDLNGPYMNQSNKYTEAEHQAEVDRINTLRRTINNANR